MIRDLEDGIMTLMMTLDLKQAKEIKDEDIKISKFLEIKYEIYLLQYLSINKKLVYQIYISCF